MHRFSILVFLLACQNSWAADISGYVTLTSDYVKRGVTQSDGDPAVQTGVDLNFENGLYLGLWGSTVNIANGPSRQRDLELDFYAGYAIDVSKSWQLSVAVAAYTYPGQTGSVDYNYEEYLLAGNFDDRVWIEVAYAPDLYNSGRSSTHVDVYAEWPINSVFAIGGGAGHYDTSDLTGRAYRYWQLGLTGSFRRLDVDLRLHDTDRWVPIISTPDRAKSRIALTLQFPF